MSLRQPASRAAIPAREAAFGALESEIVAEQASSLARAGRRLERALAELEGLDAGAARGRTGGNPSPDHSALLAEARKALWYLVVQREACGFRNSAEILSVYSVPEEVGLCVTRPVIRRQPGLRRS